MRQRELSVDNFMFTYEVIKGRRWLRVSRPIALGFTPEEAGVLLLFFDFSELCAEAQSSVNLGARSEHCRRLFDLIAVPLAPDVPRRGAEGRARYILRGALECINTERSRLQETEESASAITRRRRVSATRTHRTFAPARSDGPVGVIA